MPDIDLAPLLNRLSGLASPRRKIIAFAGPPGSGKSTLAEALEAALLADGRAAAVLPMDGFHYDDAILQARGLIPRKGSPQTFDAAGLCHLLGRLCRNAEPEIAVPLYDRELGVSRNAARIIPQAVDLLIVEGNYLLLDRPVWRDLVPHFDLTVALDVEHEELRRRLRRRWQDFDLPEAEVTRRVEENDLPNGLTVLNQSRVADLTFHQDGTVTAKS